jgi:diacylglycerol kinase
LRLLNSFRCAFRGIGYCINHERNMRIHIVVALYVFAFSFFFHLDRTQYAVLFLTFAAVFMGELLNTSAETICNRMAEHYDPGIRKIKDLASGAVLMGALFSLGVAVCLFWKPESFQLMLTYFCENPGMIVLVAVATAISLIFIELGPLGIKDKLFRKKTERRKHRG